MQLFLYIRIVVFSVIVKIVARNESVIYNEFWKKIYAGTMNMFILVYTKVLESTYERMKNFQESRTQWQRVKTENLSSGLS